MLAFSITSTLVYIVGATVAGLIVPSTAPTARTARVALTTVLERPTPAQADAGDLEQIKLAVIAPARLARMASELGVAMFEKAGNSPEELAERIQVATKSMGKYEEVAIAFNSPSGMTPTQAAALVNRLADDFVAAGNEKYVDGPVQANRSAREATEEARRQLEKTLRIYEVAVDRAATTASPPGPALGGVEPEELPAAQSRANRELDRDLAALKARRAELLLQRTPAHPEVIDVDERIEALESQRTDDRAPLESPRPKSSKSEMPRGGSPTNEQKSKQVEVEKARLRYDRAVDAERKTWEALTNSSAQTWKVVRPAEPELNQTTKTRGRWTVLVTLLAIGTGVVVAATRRPAPAMFHDPAEIAEILSLPVLGVIVDDASTTTNRSGKL
jgi:capsular polysaccharide biosynthesis protein